MLPNRPPWQLRVHVKKPDTAEFEIAGGAVLISDRLALTCDHVLRDAAAVMVVFTGSKSYEAIPARIVHRWPSEPHGIGDLALLELEIGRIPSDANPAPLRLGGRVRGHAGKVFGFPDGYDDGVLADVTISGGAMGEWLQLDPRGTRHLAKGYSGSAVWDETLDAVVAIASAADRNPQVGGGFGIPIASAAERWPDLRPWLGWRVSTDTAFTGYWSPRARGVETSSRLGNYFTGRTNLVRRLVDWLEREPPDGRVRVLTGHPGSGKSAVIAHLAGLSDPFLRARANQERRDTEPTVTAGRVSAAVLARGASMSSVTEELARMLSLSAATSEDLLAQIDRRELVVLVDALDEAASVANAKTIATGILVPLARDCKVKVLVGTRRGIDGEILRVLGSEAVVYDLDSPEFFSRDDIVAYAMTSLRLLGDPSARSAYRDEPNAAAIVADAIGDAAKSNFLVAGLAARTRADRPLVDLARPEWRAEIPGSAAAAMDEYIERFGDDARKVRNILRPLAYARGPGLPADDLWARLASALVEGHRYRIDDVGWVLDRVRDYLIETTETRDAPRFRLFHEALVTYFRSKEDDEAREARFAAALADSVPKTDGRRDWSAASPYVVSYLAGHAGAGGVLDELVVDPGFLLSAHPDGLIPALQTVRAVEARRAAAAYRSCHDVLDGSDFAEGAARLLLAARQLGAAQLAERIESDFRPSWRTTFATTRAIERRVLTRHDGLATAVLAVTVDDDTLVVSGGSDGVIRVAEMSTWRLRGELKDARGRPMLGRHDSGVATLCAATTPDTVLLVVAFLDGTVDVWDLRSDVYVRRLVAATLPEGGQSAVRAPLVAADTTRPFVTVAHGRDVSTWDLTSGAGPSHFRTEETILAIASGRLGEHPVVVTASDAGKIQAFECLSGATAGRRIAVAPKVADGVQTMTVDGRLLAILHCIRRAVEHGSPVWYIDPLAVYDLASGKRAFARQQRQLTPRFISCRLINDEPLAAVGNSSNIDVIDLRTSRRVAQWIADHEVWTATLFPFGDRFGVAAAIADGTVEFFDPQADGAVDWKTAWHDDICVARGRTTIVAGRAADSVWLWDVTSRIAVAVPESMSDKKISALCLGEIDGRVAAAAALKGARRIVVWDVETGAAIGSLEATTRDETRLVLHRRPDRTVLVASDLDEIRIFDVSAGLLRTIRLPARNEFGEPAPVQVLVGDSLRILWHDVSAVRVFDGDTGAAAPAPPRLRNISALTATTLGNASIGILGSESGQIRTWDIASKSGFRQLFKSESVNALIAMESENRMVLVAGTQAGIRMWDLATGESIPPNVPDRNERATALAVVRLDGVAHLCVGYGDGRLHVPTAGFAAEVGQPIERIWDGAGNDVVIATRIGVIALHWDSDASPPRAFQRM